jgi:hypothetical protein
VPSKRRLNILRNKPPEPRFLLDRNLGAYELKKQLCAEGFDVTAHDQVFEQLERDPWIFYWAGRNGYVMITADLKFKRLFTHQAAVVLGNTAIFSFTGSTYNSDVRGSAFIKAKSRIFRMLRKQPRPFIATILLDGSVHLDTDNPAPNRKKVEPKDWESYERVCRAEGIEPEKARIAVPIEVRGGDNGPAEGQAGTQSAGQTPKEEANEPDVSKEND